MTQEKRAPYDFNKVTKLAPCEPFMKAWQRNPTIEGTWVFVAPNPRFKPKSSYPGHRYARAVTIKISATNSVTRAYLWASSRDGRTHTRGEGDAGGGGYHKESAAINDAFGNAGIEMARAFGGCGEGPTEIAIAALAKKLGWNTGEVMLF